MAEHVFPFIIDGVRVGLTERQYGARLARQAQIDLARYHKEHPTLHSPKALVRRNDMTAVDWFIVDILRKHGGYMLPREVKEAAGCTTRQTGYRLRICCQHGHVEKSRVTGIRARYRATPLDE